MIIKLLKLFETNFRSFFYLTFNIQHLTFNIQHSTFNIQHSLYAPGSPRYSKMVDTWRGGKYWLRFW